MGKQIRFGWIFELGFLNKKFISIRSIIPMLNWIKYYGLIIWIVISMVSV